MPTYLVWASRNGAVRMFRPRGIGYKRWLASVPETNITHAGDPFGQVTSGSLVLQCSLLHLVLSFQEPSPEYLTDLDIWEVSDINSIPVAYIGRVKLDYPTPETDDPDVPRFFNYVPLISYSYLLDEVRRGKMVGLLLHSVQEISSQYRRVGWLQFDIDDSNEDILFSFVEYQKDTIELR